jgi:hypothetical protein
MKEVRIMANADFTLRDKTYCHNNGGITCSFSDKQVILVRPDDKRLATIVSDATVSSEQSYDGPAYLVIRAEASDPALERASARFGISLPDLQQFRAEVCHG